MTPIFGFLFFLALTLVSLGVVFVTGHRANLRVHIPMVVVTVFMLGATILYAERLGETLDLEAAGVIYPIHLFFAKTTTVAYLLPVITGVMTLRDRGRRKLHGKIAWTVLVLTVVTAATGTWMAVKAPALEKSEATASLD